MSVAAIFSFIVALVKAVPIVDKWIKQLIVLYIQKVQAGHDKDFAEGLAEMLTTGSQVKLEEAMRNSNAGKPSVRRDDVHERDRGGRTNPLFVGLLFFSMALFSCVTRVDVEADVWQTERIPQSLCDQVREINDFGIFRVVKCALVPKHPRCAVENPPVEFEEFIPYCSPTADKHVSMHEDDFNKWMDILTKPRSSALKSPRGKAYKAPEDPEIRRTIYQ